MTASCPTVQTDSWRWSLPAAACLLTASVLVLSACESDPGTVLQTDLPQLPGMTGRESSGLKQEGGVVETGTFAYKGAIQDLPTRVSETTSRFAGLGWQLLSERRTTSTARLEFSKGNRHAVVELIRNDLAPGMSTGVTMVTTMNTPPASGNS
jgi:hypothetical protein